MVYCNGEHDEEKLTVKDFTMDIRYIQTAVKQVDYERISRCAFDEHLTLSDMIEKMSLVYLDNKESSNQGEQKEA